MKIKFFLSLIISTVFFLSGLNQVKADSNIYITIDGKVQSFNQSPVIMEGSTLVPLRGIFEALGAKVFWDEKSRTVYAYKEGMEISLPIGSKQVYKNKQSIQLEVPAQIINDSTMVPVRFIGESLGNEVKWDENSRTVLITSTIEKTITTKNLDTKVNSNKLTTEEVGKFQDRIVYIEVRDSNGKAFASGSGVIITNDGGIITNYHVIKGGSSVRVEMSNHSSYVTTKILNQDINNDLAYIKIDSSNLPYATFGDSSKVQLGEDVVAIGSPLGLKNTLSTGVVSAVNREVDGMVYIQTSAPIDHGSSGGALFNLNGNIIGITSAGLQSQASLNLAIPSNTVTQFINSPTNPIDMIQQPIQNKPVNVQNNMKISNVNDLTEYIAQNYGYNNFQNVPLHFKVLVTQSSDGHFSVAMILNDSSEYINFLKKNIESKNAYGFAIISVIGQKVAEITGDTQPVVGIWLNYNYGKTYPSAFPAKSITVNNDGTFQLFYQRNAVIVDTLKKIFIYFLDPMGDITNSVKLPIE